MFNASFMDELFKPQTIYSNASTRLIFERLAHSSIMRLNKSSMDKLYDLMTMGFKYQVLALSDPADLIQITMNHLDNLKSMVRDPGVMQVLMAAVHKFVDTFVPFTAYEMSLVRQTLLRFFQDRRVKVSLFLQDGIQTSNGTLVLDHRGRLPTGAEQPGIVRYFNADGDVLTVDRLSLKNAPGVEPAVEIESIWDREMRPCKLGDNMYVRERKKPPPPPKDPQPQAQEDSGSEASDDERPVHNLSEAERLAAQQGVKAEMNLLAELIAPASPEDEAFEVTNLFPHAGGASMDGGSGSGRGAEIVVFHSDDVQSRMNQYAGDLGLHDFDDYGGDGDGQGYNDGDDDDLLAMMDDA